MYDVWAEHHDFSDPGAPQPQAFNLDNSTGGTAPKIDWRETFQVGESHALLREWAMPLTPASGMSAAAVEAPSAVPVIIPDDPFFEAWGSDLVSDDGDDPYDLGYVDVTGRRPTFEFDPPPPGGPSEFGGGGSGGGSGGGGGGQTTDGLPPKRDCEADAQAREALRLFLEDAASRNEFFGVRERGAFIVRNEDGSYGLINFEVGPSVFSGSGPTVQMNDAGVTGLNVIGYVHNHPSTPTLSGPDRDIISHFQNRIGETGRTHDFRMYMITNDQRINVYDKDNMHSETGVDVTDNCR